MHSLYSRQWTWPSESGRVDKKTGELLRYTISLTWEGEFLCSCPAWIYSRGERSDCKHIQHLKARGLDFVPSMRASELEALLHKIDAYVTGSNIHGLIVPADKQIAMKPKADPSKKTGTVSGRSQTLL